MTQLPKDRAEIEYSLEDGKVVSAINQSCGCIWVLTWEKSGTLEDDGIDVEYLCEDHDPTVDDSGEVVDW